MKHIALLYCLVAAAPALCDTPMTGAQFDAYSKGKTLYFASDGTAYGAEQYLDGRRVRWSYLDGTCKEGRWYESGPEICFIYEHDPDPQCWRFYASAGGLVAQFANQPDQSALYEVNQSDSPMICLGPEVGV